MKVKSSLEIGSSKIEIVEKVAFNSNNISLYKDTFNALKESGFINAEAFISPIWYLKDECDGYPFLFAFDIEIYSELNVALKGYTLIKRMSGMSSGFLTRQISLLKKIILHTHGLQHNENYEEFLFSIPKISSYMAALSLESFCSFYPFPNSGLFIEKNKMIEKPTNKNRDLPPFNQVFQFDESINHYSKTETNASIRMMFYIVELWWYITNILPMRPNEFLRFRKNCLQQRTDHSYWLEVPRSKSISEAPEKEIWYQWVQINEEIYHFIMQYIMKLNELDFDNHYLFPIEVHDKYRKIKGGKIHFDRKFLGTDQLNQWIGRFYQEIIEEKYQIYDHQKIKGGDTRHFAIINMFLQGYNMLSISRMAGQTRIESPAHYYSHLGDLVKSYTYQLASLRMKEVNIEKQLSAGFFGHRRKAYDTGKLYTKKNLIMLRPVEFGRCSDNQIPDNCVDDCRQCKHFIFSPPVNEYQQGIKWLEDYSKVIEQKIDQQINMMKVICGTTTNINKDEVEQELKYLSRNLQHFMDQKTNTDMQLLEYFINCEMENL